MVASGVRRSCDSAASTAVRTLSACRSRSPCSASRVIRSRSTASTAWAANTWTRRRSDGGSGRPYRASVHPDSGWPAGTATSAVSGLTEPSAAAATSGPALETTRSRRVRRVGGGKQQHGPHAEPDPGLLQHGVHGVGGVDARWWPRRPRSWASARPRAACRARSVLRSTTDATVTPTTTKTTRAKAFSGCVMVKEPNGGV